MKTALTLLLAAALAGTAVDARPAVVQVRVALVPTDPTLDAWCRHLGVLPPPGATQLSTGTAFWVGDPPRLVTGHHVVAGARTVTVVDADGTALAEASGPAVVHPDRQADVATLDVGIAAPASLAVGRTPKRGDGLELLGFADDGPLTTREGHAADTVERALPGATSRPLLLTDAPVAHGMSGGPVLDDAGHVVGMVLAGSTPESDLHGQGVLLPLGELTSAVARIDAAGRTLGGSLLGVHADGRVTAAEGTFRAQGLAEGDRIEALGSGAVADVEAALRARTGPVLVRVAGKGWVVVPAPPAVRPPQVRVP